MSEQNKLTADELSSYLTHLDVRTGSKVRKHVAALELEIEQQLAESKQREATLTLERDAALNALEKYGWHRMTCDIRNLRKYNPPCTCGFSQALVGQSDALAERDRNNAAACDPEIHSGTPCLYETRIPMTMLASEVGQYGAAAVIEDRHLSCTEGYLETATTRFSEWLDDRDRAALRKGSDWLDEHYGYEIAVAFIGEFGLEPKPKGK